MKINNIFLTMVGLTGVITTSSLMSSCGKGNKFSWDYKKDGEFENPITPLESEPLTNAEATDKYYESIKEKREIFANDFIEFCNQKLSFPITDLKEFNIYINILDVNAQKHLMSFDLKINFDATMNISGSTGNTSLELQQNYDLSFRNIEMLLINDSDDYGWMFRFGVFTKEIKDDFTLDEVLEYLNTQKDNNWSISGQISEKVNGKPSTDGNFEGSFNKDNLPNASTSQTYQKLISADNTIISSTYLSNVELKLDENTFAWNFRDKGRFTSPVKPLVSEPLSDEEATNKYYEALEADHKILAYDFAASINPYLDLSIVDNKKMITKFTILDIDFEKHSISFDYMLDIDIVTKTTGEPDETIEMKVISSSSFRNIEFCLSHTSKWYTMMGIYTKPHDGEIGYDETMEYLQTQKNVDWSIRYSLLMEQTGIPPKQEECYFDKQHMPTDDDGDYDYAKYFNVMQTMRYESIYLSNVEPKP